MPSRNKNKRCYLFTRNLYTNIYEVCPEKFQPLLIYWERVVQHRCNLVAKESGLECACVNNDDFAVLAGGGDRRHWVSIFYFVTIAFKMAEHFEAEQQMCIKFSVKLEHSSVVTIQMIQKAAAMGTWWLAASSQQCAHSCITSHAEFFDAASNHPGDSAPLQPRFGTLWLLAFPKA